VAVIIITYRIVLAGMILDLMDRRGKRAPLTVCGESQVLKGHGFSVP
jgi:hypothetical protein